MNAKEEFLEHIKEREVLCAEIVLDAPYEDNPLKVILKIGYSPYDFEKFLKQLDFNYDSWQGNQELYGVIWYIEGSWSERDQCDGYEWWEYRSLPEIPEYMK